MIGERANHAESAGTRSRGRLSPRCVIGPLFEATRTLPPFGAARPKIVQLVMAVHKEYSVRSWLRHRVSATIGIQLRRRGGDLKAWLQ
jgi:hypothetical protein